MTDMSRHASFCQLVKGNLNSFPYFQGLFLSFSTHLKLHFKMASWLLRFVFGLAVGGILAVAQNQNGTGPKRPYSVSFNANGFMVDDVPRLLRGGTFQWGRMPQEVWSDRLDKVRLNSYYHEAFPYLLLSLHIITVTLIKFKGMGYNTVDM